MFIDRNAVLALLVVGLSGLSASAAAPGQAAGDRKPQLVLTSSPVLAFVPAKMRFSADLRGGADDYEDFYCAAVEWDWDDGTKSESVSDCEPYQAGKSEIRRHYSAEHTYDTADNYHPTFRLKKRDKVVAQARGDVEVRPGL